MEGRIYGKVSFESGVEKRRVMKCAMQTRIYMHLHVFTYLLSYSQSFKQKQEYQR